MTVLLYKSAGFFAQSSVIVLVTIQIKGTCPEKKQLPQPKMSMTFNLLAMSWSSIKLFLRAITYCLMNEV